MDELMVGKKLSRVQSIGCLFHPVIPVGLHFLFGGSQGVAPGESPEKWHRHCKMLWHGGSCCFQSGVESDASSTSKLAQWHLNMERTAAGHVRVRLVPFTHGFTNTSLLALARSHSTSILPHYREYRRGPRVGLRLPLHGHGSQR